MSDKRRHTAVLELGWLDFLAACEDDPFIRAEGHDVEKTHARGHLVRFNLALRVLPETARDGAGRPRVHAQRLRRLASGHLVPTDTLHELRWEELDWVSWVPSSDAAGRRLKLTVTGESYFGELQVWDGGRVHDSRTNGIRDYGTHGAAVAAVLRLVGRN